MRRFLIIFLTLSLAHSLHAVAISWDRTEARVDLKPGETEARATFTVTNHEKTPLRIREIKTSCGCTGTILSSKIIEPGESTQIIGKFFKGKRSGTNHSTLDVFIEGEPESVATLKMTVDIPTLVKVTPKIVYWNQRTTHSPRTVRISIDPEYVSGIEEIEYNSDLLIIKELESPTDGNERSFEVTPKRYDQPIRTMITIKGHTQQPGIEAEARIHAFVQP